MAACVLPGDTPWEKPHPQTWVVVIVIILVQSGHLTADQALELLTLLGALFHTDREQ
ncbi:hypothetical protein [Streptomyces fagopyri]|uniref:hypothetical protein n=1 Tax=Streptomyces fagopyri TaxID=2662397 RepID=UPI001293A08E|nr:hypothetical protein [Streptomyces fagopyri]